MIENGAETLHPSVHLLEGLRSEVVDPQLSPVFRPHGKDVLVWRTTQPGLNVVAILEVDSSLLAALVLGVEVLESQLEAVVLVTGSEQLAKDEESFLPVL